MEDMPYQLRRVTETLDQIMLQVIGFGKPATVPTCFLQKIKSQMLRVLLTDIVGVEVFMLCITERVRLLNHRNVSTPRHFFSKQHTLQQHA
ncbi:hypothetical protein C5167_040907 [Papaver somniferum]|uniref:Uncharacterized protein n=1 Tax=Papaver somniferum TaxID=3469 RepID=A0A4Y7IJR5_PAPSO|nr:hypothetical protein C5167_040907 [Papaver somniferum]